MIQTAKQDVRLQLRDQFASAEADLERVVAPIAELESASIYRFTSPGFYLKYDQTVVAGG